MLQPGTRIGPYEVEALLGAGAMGEVYAALDGRLHRRVALKVLPIHLTADESRVRRFAQEARAASTLNHPNIVTIYDIGDAGSVHFIAMELVAGQTLRALVGTAVPHVTVRAWGHQLATALGVAHAAGIVHRDIKPDNVIVRDDGYVKILDFGLARLAREDESARATTAGTDAGTLLGTLRYMAPEQARGEPVSGAADVFALGTTLYELATGRHPISATTVLGVLKSIEEEEPADPAALVGDLSASTSDVIMRMLAKDPRLRPSAYEAAVVLRPDSLQVPARPAVRPLTGGGSVRASTAAQSLVGREAERALLFEAFESARAGRGSLQCVSGEPGMGKTTVVERFLADVEQDEPGARIGQGRCSERLAGTEAYLPWIEALESLCTGDVPAVIRRIAPTWFAQLRVPGSTVALLSTDQRATSQDRLKRELVALLDALAASSPLVLFFDDLHWADISTIDLLAFVGDRLASMGVLLVVTYRPSDLYLARHAFLQLRSHLQARGVCRECELSFLGEADVDAYLANEFPNHDFPSALRSLIYAKTEGSPLFMADLARHLRDRGVIARQGNTWVLAQELPRIERDLPASVRAMIERKIGQLGEEDRRILVAASVQGYQFESTVLAAALEVDAATVEERLAELDRVHGFVRVQGEDTLPDGALTLRCRFVHVLYQGALHASLSPTRRLALSRRVADAILAGYREPRGQVAAQVANLYESGRDFDRAAHHFWLAAEGARGVFANHEAVALARRGIAALQSAPSIPQAGSRELALRLIVGSSLMNIRGYAATDVEQAYADALHLAQDVDDQRGQHQALWGLALFRLIRAEYARTLDLAEHLLRLGEERSDGATLVAAHYLLGTVRFYRGELPAACDHLTRGIAISDLPDVQASQLPDGRGASSASRAQLARVLWLMGRADEAADTIATAQSLALSQGQPLAVAFALFGDMLLQQFQHHVAGTRQRAVTLRALASEHDLPQYVSWASVLEAWAASLDGDPDALSRLRDALDTQARMGSELSRPHFLALLADALLHAGRITEGLEAVEEGLATAARTSERYYEAELHRLRGELLLVRDEQQEALASFRTSQALAQQQGAAALALRAASSLARVEAG